MYRGYLGRNDLVNILGIAPASATRAFANYRSKYPDNITYDVSKTRYSITPDFFPAFEHNIADALDLVLKGNVVLRKVLDIDQSHVYVKGATFPSANVVAELTRAFHLMHCVNVDYASSSTKGSQRLFSPNSFFEAGGVWYVRGVNIVKNEYRTYKLCRFTRAESIDTPYVSNNNDDEWHSGITLTIAPHTKHEHPDALRLDLGLVDKPVINIKTNKVLAGFILSKMRVDCSKEGKLDCRMFNLQLMNRHELVDVESMNFAPGFSNH